MTDIDALIALGDGITPGDWSHGHRKRTEGMHSTQVYCALGGTIATLAWYAKPKDERGNIGTYRDANAAAIAAVPQLIAALRELRDERDALRKALKAYLRGADSGYISATVDGAARAALKGPTP